MKIMDNCFSLVVTSATIFQIPTLTIENVIPFPDRFIDDLNAINNMKNIGNEEEDKIQNEVAESKTHGVK